MRHSRSLVVAPLLVLVSACSSARGVEPAASDSDALSVGGTTTRTALTGNNTSASNLFRDEYTPDPSFFGAHIGVVSNEDNPAVSVSAPSLSDGAISKVSLHTLMPAAPATKIFFENQSWFCTKGDSPLSSALSADLCGSHIDIGYSVNTTAQVQKQVADMRSRGADGVIVDWSGTDGSGSSGTLDVKSASASVINTGALFAFKTAAEASNGAFDLVISEDEAVKHAAAANGGDWTKAVITDLAFLESTFFGSKAYYKVDGRPVVFVFGIDHYASKDGGKKVDWATVSASTSSHPLFVFEDTGHPDAAGGYAWPNPTAAGAAYAASTDKFDDARYLPGFYTSSKADKLDLSFGVGFKGFDDHVVNGWVGPQNPGDPYVDGQRYIGQQCGKTWLDAFKLANANASSIAGVQLATWDDYEEGTELETGIDNHLEVTPKLSGSTLSWTLGLQPAAPTECTDLVAGGYDLGETVHHFAVYASPVGDGENLTLIADGIAPSTRSLDLSGKLGAGSWLVYVRAVGQPSITNQLSAAVTSNGSADAGTGTGDGCSGVPTILEPTAGEDVGPSIHLRVSAPACMQAMIAYVDGAPVAKVSGDSLDQWVAVSLGTHELNVNGWAGTDQAHLSTDVTFVRTY